MKKLFFSLIIITTIFCNALAQNQSSLLWKISGNGLTKPSYIYGTIHLICPQDFSMAEKVKTSFTGIEQVYLELDFDDPQMMQKMMSMMAMNNGKTAKDYLTEEEYQLLDSKFKAKVGAGMAQLQVMKPIMLLSMSYMTILSCQPMSFETVLAQMAKEQGKEVFGLETVEYQMNAFDQIPLDKQFKMIADIIRQENKAKAEFDELVSLYKSEDIDGILKLTDDSEWSMEEFNDILINKRNKEWVDKFTTITKDKSTFFAVGAGHLGGEEGWLNLLRKIGYTVEAVK